MKAKAYWIGWVYVLMIAWYKIKIWNMIWRKYLSKSKKIQFLTKQELSNSQISSCEQKVAKNEKGEVLICSDENSYK